MQRRRRAYGQKVGRFANGAGDFRCGNAVADAPACDLISFFFSSRRRHTFFKCDWSSDVCSSDLSSLMGLDTLVSQAFGAGHREDCHRSLVNSIYLSIALTPFLTAAVWLLPTLLSGMQVDPGVLALAIPYTKALAAGLFPLLLYFAVRRCLQAMNMVRPVAFALVSANIINALGNYTLVYGKLGMPAMGAVGSGWSTAISRLYLASVLVGYLLWYDRKHRTELLRTPVEIDLPRS